MKRYDHNRIKNNTCNVTDFTLVKKNKNVSRFGKGLRKVQKMQVEVMPIIIGFVGTTPKQFKPRLENISKETIIGL